MLSLIKIIIISLFLIFCFHSIYEIFLENFGKNKSFNKNRIEYHTSKYKEILDDISIATNTFINKNSSLNIYDNLSFDFNLRDSPEKRVEESLNSSKTKCFQNRKSIHFNETQPSFLFNDIEKQEMYNELLQMI
jgi:hypothetical protein